MAITSMDVWVATVADGLRGFERAVFLGRAGSVQAQSPVAFSVTGAGIVVGDVPESVVGGAHVRASSLFAAFELAASRLASREVDSVVVVEGRLASEPSPATGDGCWLDIAKKPATPPRSTAFAAVTLTRAEGSVGALCLLEAAARVDGPLDADTVSWAAQLALGDAAIAASDVGYVEIAASADAEIEGLSLAYRARALSIAVGCATSAIGRTDIVLAALVKVALALDGRFIPGTAAWTGPRVAGTWTGSAFYVPESSRPWFTASFGARRLAGVSACDASGATHFILAEPSRGASSRYSPLLPLQLHRADAAVLVRGTDEELAVEAAAAKVGVVASVASGVDWQSPRGSQFSPRPLGERGKIAFVYPGALSPYPGAAADLFRVFPCVWDEAAAREVPLAAVLADTLLYPRGLEPAGATADARLMKDLPAMIHAGAACGAAYTWALRAGLGVVPDMAVGYSLGQSTMLWALDAWTEEGFGMHALKETPLFRDEIGGEQQAIREYWKGAGIQTRDGEPIWGSVVVRAPRDVVLRMLEGEPGVLLTAINTPNELVIAGLPRDVKRVLDQLQARHGIEGAWIPGDNALHCEAVASRERAIERFCTRQTHEIARTTFYVDGAACSPMASDLAPRLARGLVTPIDFPRIVEGAYADGARVFVECGPRSTCTRWIAEILKGRDHVVVGFDRKGVSAQVSALKLVARLRAHGVRLALPDPPSLFD